MEPSFNVIRPQDPLNFKIETTNLQLDNEDPDHPQLVAEDRERPAYIAFIFPPQTIAERAYFEAAIVGPEGDPDNPDPDAGSVTEPLDPPGYVDDEKPTAAQMGHPSRPVFEVSSAASIPFTIGGLLDWPGLGLSANPIADIGDNPSNEEINNAPVIRLSDLHRNGRPG